MVSSMPSRLGLIAIALRNDFNAARGFFSFMQHWPITESAEMTRVQLEARSQSAIERVKSPRR